MKVQVAVNVHLVLVLVDVGQVYDLGELIGVEHPILPRQILVHTQLLVHVGETPA